MRKYLVVCFSIIVLAWGCTADNRSSLLKCSQEMKDTAISTAIIFERYFELSDTSKGIRTYYCDSLIPLMRKRVTNAQSFLCINSVEADSLYRIGKLRTKPWGSYQDLGDSEIIIFVVNPETDQYYYYFLMCKNKILSCYPFYVIDGRIWRWL